MSKRLLIFTDGYFTRWYRQYKSKSDGVSTINSGGGYFYPDHWFSFKTAFTTAFTTVGNAFLTVRNECGGQVIPDRQECIPDRRECQNHSRRH